MIMEYLKIANLTDDAQINSLNLHQKNWIEKKNESRGIYNINSQI